MKTRIFRLMCLLIAFYICGAFVTLDWNICRWLIFNEELGRIAFLSCLVCFIGTSRYEIKI